MTDFDSLLSGDDDISTINPEVVDAGQEISEALLEAGTAAWGTLIGCGVMYTAGSTRFTTASECLADEKIEAVCTTIEWSGDREGYIQFIVPALLAKGVVAKFTALMSGTEAKPEETELDAEGMDAYQEAINNLLGQGSQALRQKIKGELTLKATDTWLVNFEESPPAVELGNDEALCHTCQITIEGMMPMASYLLMPVAVTGMDRGIEVQNAGKSESLKKSGADNAAKCLKIKLPLIVILADAKMRMSTIQDMSPGTIMEFKKLSGEMLDIYAGRIKIAEGEVVTTNQHFGIQFRRLIDPRAASNIA